MTLSNDARAAAFIATFVITGLMTVAMSNGIDHAVTYIFSVAFAYIFLVVSCWMAENTNVGRTMPASTSGEDHDSG